MKMNFCSDLLKHERLAFPVPPPEPVNDKKRMVAILPYTKMPDTDEITFQVTLKRDLSDVKPFYDLKLSILHHINIVWVIDG